MKLKVSELFYSAQGEGRYVGVPSVFLRTFGCNFTCSGFGCKPGEKSTEADEVAKKVELYKTFEELPLVATGCDSYASWHPDFKHLSPTYTAQELADRMTALLPNGAWQQPNGNPVHLVITGGEPLLSKETFRVLDSLISNPKPQISIQINSNLCVPSELFEKFISKLMILQHTNDIVVHTSAEAHGARAEYIRHGMNYNQWLDNCEYFLEKVQRGKLNIMSTYNALSVTSYTEFLKDVYRLNKKYSSRFIFFKSRNAVSLDIPYLNNPKHQTVEILTKDFLPLIDQQILFMKEHEHYLGFSEDETQKLSRLLSVFRPLVDNTDNEVQLMIDRRDFAIFVDEHDKRRGTNFLKTFPEMEEFYNLCKAINY